MSRGGVFGMCAHAETDAPHFAPNEITLITQKTALTRKAWPEIFIFGIAKIIQLGNGNDE